MTLRCSAGYSICHYYTQDYLGNNRAVINGSIGAIEQTVAYYPWGGVIASNPFAGHYIGSFKYEVLKLIQEGKIKLSVIY